jgi:hypothetical protein
MIFSSVLSSRLVEVHPSKTRLRRKKGKRTKIRLRGVSKQGINTPERWRKKEGRCKVVEKKALKEPFILFL